MSPTVPGMLLHRVQDTPEGGTAGHEQGPQRAREAQPICFKPQSRRADLDCVHDMPFGLVGLAETPTGAGNGGIPVQECLLARSRSPSGTQPRGGWEVWGLCPLCCVPSTLALTLHSQQVPGCAFSSDEAPPGALPLLPRPLITPNSNSHIRDLGPAWSGLQPQG